MAGGGGELGSGGRVGSGGEVGDIVLPVLLWLLVPLLLLSQIALFESLLYLIHSLLLDLTITEDIACGGTEGGL